MTDEMIARINELAKKKKTVGLTAEETAEQTALRAEYIASFRKNLRMQLDQISIREADGSITNLGEKFGKHD
ncbi:MAG: DUF896 domain-containing protein [Lachnospiraceae bacterium]|nr:DUF896 domain-containing protein [Lachnospiraceae bacterium]MDY5741690.1 DUF896 domain-containing protein [Lachnospiraceae bacterium]